MGRDAALAKILGGTWEEGWKIHVPAYVLGRSPSGRRLVATSKAELVERKGGQERKTADSIPDLR